MAKARNAWWKQNQTGAEYKYGNAHSINIDNNRKEMINQTRERSALIQEVSDPSFKSVSPNFEKSVVEYANQLVILIPSLNN